MKKLLLILALAVVFLTPAFSQTILQPFVTYYHDPAFDAEHGWTTNEIANADGINPWWDTSATPLILVLEFEGNAYKQPTTYFYYPVYSIVAWKEDGVMPSYFVFALPNQPPPIVTAVQKTAARRLSGKFFVRQVLKHRY